MSPSFECRIRLTSYILCSSRLTRHDALRGGRREDLVCGVLESSHLRRRGRRCRRARFVNRRRDHRSCSQLPRRRTHLWQNLAVQGFRERESGGAPSPAESADRWIRIKGAPGTAAHDAEDAVVPLPRTAVLTPSPGRYPSNNPPPTAARPQPSRASPQDHSPIARGNPLGLEAGGCPPPDGSRCHCRRSARCRHQTGLQIAYHQAGTSYPPLLISPRRKSRSRLTSRSCCRSRPWSFQGRASAGSAKQSSTVAPATGRDGRSLRSGARSASLGE